jgi:hypothetical protein
MKAWGTIFLCLWISGLMPGIGQDAQNKWSSLPTVPLRPDEPELIGAAIGAIAKRGQRESTASVVISVAKRWGTAHIGVLVKDQSKLISEKELWPYMGPDPGHEAMNPRMMEITLISSRGNTHYNSQMLMSASGNFPKGITDEDVDLFDTNNKTNKQFIAFLDDMKEGFDYGIVQIGRGVFSPPLEVRFGGQNAKGVLTKLMQYVRDDTRLRRQNSRNGSGSPNE